MKPLLGIVGGFVVSLGMFAGGLAAATFLLTAEPERQPGLSQDAADLWTGQPRKVNTDAQDFERLPALQVPADPKPPAEAQTVVTGNVKTTDLASGPLDTVAASSLQTPSSEDLGQLTPDQSAHAEWCANRYRSYRPEDNSYTRYSGGYRPCVSPYSDGLTAAYESGSPAPSDPDSYAQLVGDPSTQLLQYASNDEEGSYATSDHATYCFSRYRSYRPEDNTYQPYGGGPRRQCR